MGGMEDIAQYCRVEAMEEGEALAALERGEVTAVLALPENRGKLAFLGRVKDARFKRQVVPGDVVELECRLIRQKGPVGVGECVAKVDGETAVTAELTFAVQQP